jgi:hypothetical protein
MDGRALCAVPGPSSAQSDNVCHFRQGHDISFQRAMQGANNRSKTSDKQDSLTRLTAARCGPKVLSILKQFKAARMLSSSVRENQALVRDPSFFSGKMCV